MVDFHYAKKQYYSSVQKLVVTVEFGHDRFRIVVFVLNKQRIRYDLL